MRNKIFAGMAVLAIAAVSVCNINLNSGEKLRVMALANVEALANNESGSVIDCCSSPRSCPGAYCASVYYADDPGHEYKVYYQ